MKFGSMPWSCKKSQSWFDMRQSKPMHLQSKRLRQSMHNLSKRQVLSGALNARIHLGLTFPKRISTLALAPRASPLPPLAPKGGTKLSAEVVARLPSQIRGAHCEIQRLPAVQLATKAFRPCLWPYSSRSPRVAACCRTASNQRCWREPTERASAAAPRESCWYPRCRT